MRGRIFACQAQPQAPRSRKETIIATPSLHWISPSFHSTKRDTRKSRDGRRRWASVQSCLHRLRLVTRRHFPPAFSCAGYLYNTNCLTIGRIYLERDLTNEMAGMTRLEFISEHSQIKLRLEIEIASRSPVARLCLRSSDQSTVAAPRLAGQPEVISVRFTMYYDVLY